MGAVCTATTRRCQPAMFDFNLAFIVKSVYSVINVCAFQFQNESESNLERRM